MKKREPVIIIEGPIGAGKSTLADELGEAMGPSTLVLHEPDEKNDANPYLADYYTDPSRWSLTMQLHLLGLRFGMHLDAQWHALNGRGPAVLDRSFYGDTGFARLQRALGIMSEREFNTYSRIYQHMTSFVLYPTVCIRILVSPEVCNERIARRMEIQEGRKCEKAIDLGYLKKLDKEIDHVVSVLKFHGTMILDVPYDVDRDTKQQRQQAVRGLASRIGAIDPPDHFLDLHNRII